MGRQMVLALAGSLIMLVAIAGPASSANPSPSAAADTAAQVTIPLYSGIGTVNYPVTTNSTRAQKYFDQGLAFAYGFNHDEAELSFRQAARIDPQMAMAYWGIALVLGPNYNQPGDEQRETRAYKAMVQAQALDGSATAKERDLIAALAQRYGDDSKETPARDQAYADAMRSVAHRYPDDADVETLFAESLMDVHPWQLWSLDGKPGVDTIEIVATLESVLKKHPNHIGANHYFIHAIEASGHPSRAMPSANRLAELAPAAGHLVHMPAHIYINTGRFHDAARANENAIRADEAFFAKSNESGVYLIMYYAHNLQFLCYAQMMEGRSRDALVSARKLNSRVPLAAVREMPMAEYLLPISLQVEARFGEWDAIMHEPAPPSDLQYASGMWHYTRGLALAVAGKLNEAEHEREELHKITTAIAPDRVLGTDNQARKVSELAEAVLAGEIASAKGDRTKANARLADAVRMQDALNYDEPPIWYFPTREALGAELLAAGRAAQAEAVYRNDLKLNPGNPRSLNGLARCLRAEGKAREAAKFDDQFKDAWRYADSNPEPIHLGNALPSRERISAVVPRHENSPRQ
jgi:tetratricopeptide (TPR) repeat protein